MLPLREVAPTSRVQETQATGDICTALGAGAACDVKGFNALILNSYKRALAVEWAQPRARGAKTNMLDFNHASLSSG